MDGEPSPAVLRGGLRHGGVSLGGSGGERRLMHAGEHQQQQQQRQYGHLQGQRATLQVRRAVTVACGTRIYGTTRELLVMGFGAIAP